MYIETIKKDWKNQGNIDKKENDVRKEIFLLRD